MNLTVKLPKPHAKQAAFIESNAKRRVIVAGRRGGKTTGVANLAVTKFLAGKNVLEAAPTADQTGAFWRAVTKIMQPLIDAGIVRRNKTERLLEMPATGARLRCKTAWNANTLRGDGADLLILDEYSIMNPSAWDEVGAPMLLDNDGEAVFIFTPKRKNHAYTTYQKAIVNDSGRWGHWHFTSYDNPYLSRAALDEIAGDMSADALRQEIYAEFLDNEGAVFRNLDAACSASEAAPHEHAGHDILFGVDWGKTDDYTAISALCLTCKRELFIKRWNDIAYTQQIARVDTLRKIWQPFLVVAESNSIGEPLIDMLVDAGAPIKKFVTTAQSKGAAIDALALGLERAEWRWTDDPVARAELETYESRAGELGKIKYSAPSGLHDDTVMARAIAFHEATSGSRWLLV